MGFRASLLPALTMVLSATARPGAAQSTDSAARVLVGRVIAHRRAMLSALGRLEYQAFVKLAARDLRAPSDSARSVLFLTEVGSRVYWESPDRYQETIEARHRPNEGGIGRAPVTVEEMANFERRRVILQEGGDASRVSGQGSMRSSNGGHENSRYSLPLPVAPGALARYDYAIAETLSVDGGQVIRLTVRPKTDDIPLFAGTVDILDSTGDVVAMDLGVNAAVRFPTIRDLHYQQRSRDMGTGAWLPYEIRLSGTLRRKLSAAWLPRHVVGMPLPEFPKQVSFEEVAALSEFSVASAQRPPDLAEYRAVMRDQADHPDSEIWSAPEAVPLTEAEREAWAEGDSAERHPGFVPRMARDADAVQRVAFGPGFYHFNRVDGLYVGAAHDWRPAPAVTVTTKLGYALGREQWQYRAGVRVMLSTARQLWAGVVYRDETASWASLVPGGYDPASAFVNRIDPNDYYRDHGLMLSLGAKLLDFTRLELRYSDTHQSTLDTLPGAGFRSTRLPPLPNPPIRDGHLRALGAVLTFDSRQMVRSRGVDTRLSGPNWTRASVGVDVAAHDILASDFSFRRYTFQVQHRQQLGGLGSTTVTVAGGLATHFAPPQQYFTVGYGLQLFAAEGAGFNTLSRIEYAGNRALMVTLRHDFGRLTRIVPATLSFHGGVFWTDLNGNSPAPADSVVTMARRPYTEAGFTLGNLTPFLAPFDFAASFTWQLSSYPTRPFRFGFGFSGL
jgi:hypothetical protein